MRLLVVGAGATGAFFGALASRGGADVTLLARGAHGAAMKQHGVTVERLGESFTVSPRVVLDLGEVAGESFELVLVTVKAPDLPPLLPRLAELGGTVVTAQNGVDAEPLAAAYVPPERLVAAVQNLGAALVAPGHVKVVTKDSRRRRHHRALSRRHPRRQVGEARVEQRLERSHGHHRQDRRGRRLGDVGTSTLHDARAGRPLEVEALAGSIVRRARAHKIPTPMNDILYALLKARSSVRSQ